MKLKKLNLSNGRDETATLTAYDNSHKNEVVFQKKNFFLAHPVAWIFGFELNNFSVYIL